MFSRYRGPIKNLLIIALLIFAGWWLGGYDDLNTSDYSGIPTIIDGDSLELEYTQIRLFGIDAPEIGQECRKGKNFYNCGTKARSHLRKLIGASIVTCHEEEVDRYDRIVAECFAKDKNLSSEMVKAGWALSYLNYASPFLKEEAEAQKHKRGLWQGDFQEPAEYRRDNKLEFDW